MNARILLPFTLLVGLQVLDIAVHVASNQIEPLRVIGNVLLGLGAVLLVRMPARGMDLGRAGGGIYAALNIIFVIQHGVLNADTGAPRLLLLVFVVISLVLLVWLAWCVREV